MLLPVDWSAQQSSRLLADSSGNYPTMLSARVIVHIDFQNFCPHADLFERKKIP